MPGALLFRSLGGRASATLLGFVGGLAVDRAANSGTRTAHRWLDSSEVLELAQVRLGVLVEGLHHLPGLNLGGLLVDHVGNCKK